MIRCLVLLSIALTLIAVEPVDLRTEYANKAAAITDTDTAHFSLGQWCLSHGLEAEGRQQFEATIARNPEHAQARKRLGYEKVKGQWLHGPELYQAKGYVQYHGRWLPPNDVTRIEVRQRRFRELAKQRSDWANTWELKTPHFIVRSNCPPAQVQEMVRSLERCYEQLAKIFKPKKHAPIPIDICATFDQYQDLSAKEGIPVGLGMLGYFYYGSSMGIRTYWSGSLDRTCGTLFHECTHLVIRMAYNEVPIWANEGMAVFFEFGRVSESGFDIRSIPFDRLWHLNDQLKEGEVKLRTLVGLESGFEYSVEYYPQGWGLIHYLLYGNKGRYLPALEKYYQLQQRRGQLADFETTFGKPPEGIQDDWVAYIGSLKPVSVDDLMAAANAAIEYRGDAEQALMHAAAAVKLAPNDWRTGACTARVKLQQARLENDAELAREALEAFRTALAKRPALARGKKRNLRELNDDYLCGLAAVWAGDTEAALAASEDILEQDDFNADAYRLQALALATAPEGQSDLAEARAALAVADDLGPGHENEYVRARIAVAAGDTTKAIKLLEAAAEGDYFGFGRQFYAREAWRLGGSKRRMRVVEE